MSEPFPNSPMPTPGAEPAPTRLTRWGPWSTFAWGLGAGGVMAVTQTSGALLYIVWHNAGYPTNPIKVDQLASNGPALSAAFISSAPFFIGFLLLAARLSRETIVEYLALKWPRPRHVLIGIVALAAVLGISGFAADYFQQEAPDFAFDTFDTADAAGVLPLYVLAFVVIAPVQEELLFRGFLYRGFARSLGPALAIAILSGVWASFHVQYHWFFVGEIFLLGLTFGWLRWMSNSTLLTIGLHAIVNSLAVLQAALAGST
jgi:membrane protease YdiL (CAAX protease family)